LGLALVILSLALLILGAMIEVPRIAGISWLVSGIGLALYANGSGRQCEMCSLSGFGWDPV